MALISAWPVSSERRGDWERMIQMYGFCEVTPDRTKPAQTEKAFREWAMKRRLACVHAENLVAFDPKAFNPKDTLDRSKFGFLLRYIRPRDYTSFRRDLETAFNVRSVYVLDAIKSYWMTEGVIHDVGGKIVTDGDLLRLIGFTYLDLMQALDGVVKREYLAQVSNGHNLIDPVFAVEVGSYLVNYEILKERFFDAEFLIHAAGQPIAMDRLADQMGIDNREDMKTILRESKKRFELNVEITEDHVMFGPPTQGSIDALISRERGNKQKMEQSESALKERLKTVKDLLDRYNSREAKILNECETLKEEGRVIWSKNKIVNAVINHINNGRK